MTDKLVKYARHGNNVAFTSYKGTEHYEILTVSTYGLARMHHVQKGN